MRMCLPPLLALGVAAAPATAQTPSFTASTSSAAGAPRAVAAADFNRDGWIDYASAGTGRDSVGIHLNRAAAGGFSFVHDIVVAGGPFEMAAGDLNRDAIPDLAIANADLHTVTILLGNGDGSFRPKTDLPVAGNPRGIALADHDKDGRLDIFVTRYAEGTWTVFYGDGEGGTRAEATHAAGLNPQGITTADLNNDGLLDVVVANVSSGVTVSYSNGPSTWTQTTVPGSAPGNVLVAGDFDRDGRPDLAVASTSSARVSLFRGGASGLQFVADLTTGSSPRGIIATDLNQDGVLDLVTANRGASTVTMFAGRPDASGQFAAAQHPPAGSGSRAIATGDVNHDGRVDLIAVNEFGNSATVLLNNTALVTAAFSFHVERPLGENDTGFGSPDILEVADFDRNGKLDFVVASTIRFDGTARSLTLPLSTVEEVAIGDFDRDGNDDIAALSYWENNIRVFLGDGAGGFTALAPVDVTRGFDIEAADLNRDGSPDLVVRRFDEGLGMPVLRVFYSRGDGTFAPGGDVRGPRGLNYFAIADIDRDGFQDFVTGHSNFVDPAGVGVLYGDAAGTWLRTEFYPTGRNTDCCARLDVGDFDENGLPDVVMLADSKLLLFAGQAGGGLASPVEQPSGDYSYSILTADMNRDGHLDVVLPASDILFGRGDGTFELRRFHYYDEGGTQAIVDFNRDGLPDVVSGTLGWFNVMVNERNATNRPPVANAGPDWSESYAGQFGEETTELEAFRSSDPDLHELTFEWRNEAGEVVSTGDSFSPRFPRPGIYTFTLIASDGYGGAGTGTVTWTITPFKEIVLHTDISQPHGAWQQVEDASAASGFRLFHPDAAAPKVMTPLANPANYVEITFAADSTQAYKLWIRGRAERNFWGNDSVWVQFSGAVGSSGNAYAIGTTSALAWNLEECSGCGISGWGWEDDAWGAPNQNGETLRFPDGGIQTIRVQTREDGVSIDQIVLSADKYLTARPGAAKNDTVILWRTFY
jgi:FG-GAP-like repeat/PKD domain